MADYIGLLYVAYWRDNNDSSDLENFANYHKREIKQEGFGVSPSVGGRSGALALYPSVLNLAMDIHLTGFTARPYASAV